MDTDFETHFQNYFNPDKSKEARKNFNCRLCDLYRTYPTIFSRGYKSIPHLRNSGIQIIEGKEEEAKKIMRSLYIPDLINNGIASIHYCQNKSYVSKSGLPKEYTTKHVYIHLNEKHKKFEELDKSPEVKKIMESNLSLSDKSYEIHSLFPNLTAKQIYGYLYRKV